jgi:hypothetical protein
MHYYHPTETYPCVQRQWISPFAYPRTCPRDYIPPTIVYPPLTIPEPSSMEERIKELIEEGKRKGLKIKIMIDEGLEKES